MVHDYVVHRPRVRFITPTCKNHNNGLSIRARQRRTTARYLCVSNRRASSQPIFPLLSNNRDGIVYWVPSRVNVPWEKHKTSGFNICSTLVMCFYSFSLPRSDFKNWTQTLISLVYWFTTHFESCVCLHCTLWVHFLSSYRTTHHRRQVNCKRVIKDLNKTGVAPFQRKSNHRLKWGVVAFMPNNNWCCVSCSGSFPWG